MSHVLAVGALVVGVCEGDGLVAAVGCSDGDDEPDAEGDDDVAPRLHELTVLPPPPESPANDQPISFGYEPLPAATV